MDIRPDLHPSTGLSVGLLHPLLLLLLEVLLRRFIQLLFVVLRRTSSISRAMARWCTIITSNLAFDLLPWIIFPRPIVGNHLRHIRNRRDSISTSVEDQAKQSLFSFLSWIIFLPRASSRLLLLYSDLSLSLCVYCASLDIYIALYFSRSLVQTRTRRTPSSRRDQLKEIFSLQTDWHSKHVFRWSECQSHASGWRTGNWDDARSLQKVLFLTSTTPTNLSSLSSLIHRMTGACHKKCVIPRYKDSELTKGTSSEGSIASISHRSSSSSRWIGVYRSLCGQVHGSEKILRTFGKIFPSLSRFMIGLGNNWLRWPCSSNRGCNPLKNKIHPVLWVLTNKDEEESSTLSPCTCVRQMFVFLSLRRNK